METSRISAIAENTSNPGAGIRAVPSFRVLADTQELQPVEAALRLGMKRLENADALGVTRQAVHKRTCRAGRLHDSESQKERMSRRSSNLASPRWVPR